MTARSSRYILVGIVALVYLLSFTTVASAKTVLYDSFSKGSISKTWKVRGGCSKCVKASKGALHITNKQGKEKRVEMLPKSKKHFTPYNKTVVWEFKVKLTKATQKRFAIVAQNISYPWRGVDFMLATNDLMWKAYVRKGGTKSSRKVSKTLGKVKVGKWVNVKIEYKRHTKNGVFKIKVDGKSWSYKGPTTQSTHPEGRTKFGIYTGSTKRGSFEAQFDNVKVTHRR